jgi:hypothetical protein
MCRVPERGITVVAVSQLGYKIGSSTMPCSPRATRLEGHRVVRTNKKDFTSTLNL